VPWALKCLIMDWIRLGDGMNLRVRVNGPWKWAFLLCHGTEHASAFSLDEAADRALSLCT
jgi:hypothetical protein